MAINSSKIILGIVADDFTGASDAASFLAEQGIKTLLFNGIPKNSENLQDCSAAVIALKCRSIDSHEAVKETHAAFEWFKQCGVKHFYYKYCSTFDSTPDGNIGQVIDNFLDCNDISYTLICPSLPVNGRKVINGHLYVNDIPLHESHMKDHPLNPMWDSEIAKLIEPQGKYPCFAINKALLQTSKENILQEVSNFSKNHPKFYIVPDYSDDLQGEKIVEVFGDLAFLTGGSGILEHLANYFKKSHSLGMQDKPLSETKGNVIILSGSCSKATKEQIENYIKTKAPCEPISGEKIVNNSKCFDSTWDFVEKNIGQEPLVYSTGGDVNELKNKDVAGKAAILFEKLFSEIAEKALKKGVTRFIVAGGETSGAVMLKLGFDSFLIGESIAPGVPVMIPCDYPHIRLILKSGNFGGPDFFKIALDKTRG